MLELIACYVRLKEEKTSFRLGNHLNTKPLTSRILRLDKSVCDHGDWQRGNTGKQVNEQSGGNTEIG